MRRIAEAFAALEDIIRRGTLGVEEDIGFHRTIAEATGNRFFVETLAALHTQMTVGINLNRNLSLIQPRDRLLNGQKEHRDIFDAVAARDENGARNAMRTHIENARKRVFEGG